MSGFKQSQYQLAAHLRDPAGVAAPGDVEARRVAIYRELIYKNIEGFIASGFPILRQITADGRWHDMVRDFVRLHRARSPYFLEISQEFLGYLQRERDVAGDPAFMLELAHYEWVELALSVSAEALPAPLPADGDLLAARPRLSPLAWNLSYQFPVHRIGPGFQPAGPPDQPTFLIVYRNRGERVSFMESNVATSRLLTLLEGNAELTGEEALLLLAKEMRAPDPQAILAFGKDLLEKLLRLDIVVG